MKRMLCLVGESGSGKTTIAEHLELLGYKVLPSYTTRPRRSESEKHHTFVTTEEFTRLRNDLVAYTMFNGYEYGATQQQFEECDIYVIDLNGLKSLIERAGRDSYCAIYLATKEETRQKRMEETRGIESAKQRIEHDRKAFQNMPAKTIDLVLRNENPVQLEKNVLLLHELLTTFKSDS